MFVGIYPQNALAQGWNNERFLELPLERQHSWLNGAFDTAAHIALLEDTERGECIWDWYFEEDRDEKLGLALASIRQYPESSPTGIVIALAERACGQFPR